MEPVSLHNPILAGGITAVNGTQIIDTGLRELQSFAATLYSPTAGVAPTANMVSWGPVVDGASTAKVMLLVDSEVALGVKATGSITTVTVAELLDTDYFTVNDGTISKIFEFDVANDGVTAGRVAVNLVGATSANDVRDRIITAINGVQNFNIVASSGGAATVTLTNKLIGTIGNVSNSENVVDTDFAISNMTGGVNEGVGMDIAQVSWLALGK